MKLNVIRSKKNTEDNGSNLYLSQIKRIANEKKVETEVHVAESQEEFNQLIKNQKPYLVLNPCEFQITDKKGNMEQKQVVDAIGEYVEKLEIPNSHIVILNRSKNIGRPLAELLLDRDYTVSVCHSKTNALIRRNIEKSADIIVYATGRKQRLKKNRHIIDVSADIPQELRKYCKSYTSRGEIGKRTTELLIESVKKYKD